MCLVPLWDPKLAAAEVRRNAARGVRAVCFSEQPSNFGLPSVHDAERRWDPFVAACEETGTVICMHSGSGSKMPSTSPDAPPAVGSLLTHELAEQSLADWLFSGLLVQLADTGVLDREYIEQYTGGFDEALARARSIAGSVGATALATGLSEPDVAAFFQMFAATPRVVTLYSQGVNQSAQGTDKVNAILNCHLATGRIGLPGA